MNKHALVRYPAKFSTKIMNNNRRNVGSSYKDVLSQPPAEISHSQKLLWLQKRRTAGLWAQCDDCDRWRFLNAVLDRHELPAKWYCWMNAG